MTVEPQSVLKRRELHFHTIEDIRADVERLAQGPVQTLGGWSGGQILRHLALGITLSIDGAPNLFPWHLRLLGRLLKPWFLRRPMRPGLRLKNRAADLLLPPETGWEEGLALFRQAVRRYQTETVRRPSPFLGPLTAAEWDQLHCRHAELHLSFLLPADR